MCQFFSFVSDGKTKYMYFDHELREKCLSGKLNYDPDSHTSIADYYGYKGDKEDNLNKYEYNPLTGKFRVDQLNTVDDSKEAKKFVKSLDFKEIVPRLRVQKIVNPLSLKERKKITAKDLELLKKWASVRDSVGDSVGNSVWYSVRDSVRDSVKDSVWDSVWYSVGDSVGDSVWYSVRDSVKDSVWYSVWDSVWYSVGDSVRYSVGHSVGDSVGDSVWAYTSDFFDIPEYKYIKHKKGVNPYQSCIDLYKRGLVPSFDGTKWRLHTGKDAKIIWEGEL